MGNLDIIIFFLKHCHFQISCQNREYTRCGRCYPLLPSNKTNKEGMNGHNILITNLTQFENDCVLRNDLVYFFLEEVLCDEVTCDTFLSESTENSLKKHDIPLSDIYYALAFPASAPPPPPSPSFQCRHQTRMSTTASLSFFFFLFFTLKA